MVTALRFITRIQDADDYADAHTWADAATFGSTLKIVSTAPSQALWNTTQEDTEGGRESHILFEGEQSGGEHTTLAKIQASHDGTGDDQKGELLFFTNRGSDGNSPVEAARIDSAGLARFFQQFIVTSPNPSMFLVGDTYVFIKPVTGAYGEIGAYDTSLTWIDLVLQRGGGNLGVGTSTPKEILDVEVGTNEAFRISSGSATFGFPTGATSPTHGFGLTRTGDGNLTTVIFAEGTEGNSLGIKARHDINFYGDQIRNVTFLENGRIGFGITAPTAMLHVDQKSTTAAIPVLLLDQADVSEEMIEFVTTIGVGNAIEAKGTKALTTTHFLKVTLPGALTRYIPCGTIA